MKSFHHVCPSRCRFGPDRGICARKLLPWFIKIEGMRLEHGKYAGTLFQDVAAQDKSYCFWVLKECRSAETTPNLRAFAQYIRQEHGGVLLVGKHRGSFYKDLLSNERDYCEWAAALPEPSCALKDFSQWSRVALAGFPDEAPVPESPPKKQRAQASGAPPIGASTCTICCDAGIDSAFVPCGHSVACFECARKIDRLGTCPICRDPVNMALRLFGA